MIYMHSTDGKVNKYGPMSGIEHIVVYRCSHEAVGCETVKVADRNIFLAATDIDDAYRLMDMYEEDHDFFQNTKFNPIYTRSCVRGNNGNIYTYWCRYVVRIDWSRDYHFYEDELEEYYENE